MYTIVAMFFIFVSFSVFYQPNKCGLQFVYDKHLLPNQLLNKAIDPCIITIQIKSRALYMLARS